MTDTEPRTIKELHEVAAKIEKILCEEELTVEETLIVLMVMKDTAAANLAARTVMEKMSVDMEKMLEMVESNPNIKLVELKPAKKNIPVVPMHKTSNN